MNYKWMNYERMNYEWMNYEGMNYAWMNYERMNFEWMNHERMNYEWVNLGKDETWEQIFLTFWPSPSHLTDLKIEKNKSMTWKM